MCSNILFMSFHFHYFFCIQQAIHSMLQIVDKFLKWNHFPWNHHMHRFLLYQQGSVHPLHSCCNLLHQRRH